MFDFEEKGKADVWGIPYWMLERIKNPFECNSVFS